MTAIYLTKAQILEAAKHVQEHEIDLDHVCCIYVVSGRESRGEETRQDWLNPETGKPISDDDLVVGIAQCIEDMPPEPEMPVGLGMAVKQSY